MFPVKNAVSVSPDVEAHNRDIYVPECCCVSLAASCKPMLKASRLMSILYVSQAVMEGKQDVQRWKPVDIIMILYVTIANFYRIFNVFLSVYAIIRDDLLSNQLLGLPIILSLTISIWFVFASAIFTMQSRRWVEYFQHWKEYSQEHEKPRDPINVQKLRNKEGWKFFCFSALVVFMLFASSFCVLTYIEHGNHKTFNNISLSYESMLQVQQHIGIPESYFSYSSSTITILTIYSGIIQFLNICCLVLPQMLYIHICDRICHEFLDVAKQLQQRYKQQQETREDLLCVVETSRKRYHCLIKLVEETDKIFGVYVFIVSSAELVILLFTIFILTVTKTEISFGSKDLYTSAIFLFLCGSSLISRSIVAARVAESSSDVLNVLFDMDVTIERINHMTLSQISYYIQRVNSRVGLTAMKFFTLDRGVILTVASCLATYLIVLYQFVPSANFDDDPQIII